MNYIKQFGIIIFLSFIGEILYKLLPLPIPPSIYGIIILFLCLELKIISISAIKESSRFFIEIMPIMFIPAAVGLIDSWQIIKTAWIPYTVITIVSTIVVMVVSGKIVQFIIKLSKKEKGITRNK